MPSAGGKLVASTSTSKVASNSQASTSKVLSKISQRPSWSCVSCAKKKIKCDKVVPCGSCIRRGKASECKLAEQDPTLPTRENPHEPKRMATESEFDALRQSVLGIRTRLFHVEKALSSFVPAIGLEGEALFAYTPTADEGLAIPIPSNQSGKSSAEFRARSESIAYSPNDRIVIKDEPLPVGHQNSSAELDDEVEAAVTLEFLALGRDQKNEHFARAGVRRPEDDEEEGVAATSISVLHGNSPSTIFDPFFSSTSSASLELPVQHVSEWIIRFSLESVIWQHSVVHPPTFMEELAEFHTWGERRGALVNQSWLGLYYALLCAGVKHMTTDNAINCGIPVDSLAKLPKQYYDSSISSLQRANFLVKASILSCQTIIVLNFTSADIGGSDFSATILSLAIRIAQHLMIHRFSSDDAWDQRRRRNGVDPSSPAGVKGLITREIRKRLWAALTTDDWFGAAHRRPYAIFPLHFSTPLPLNCTDEDLATGQLIDRPLEQPTLITKLIISRRVAECVRRFFEDMSSTGGNFPPELCRQVDQDIRAVIRDGPSFVRPETNIDHLPAFVASLRRYFLVSTDHKLLVIHRTFVGSSLRGSAEQALSRSAMIDAARRILYQFSESEGPYQEIWTLPFHAVAGATTIALELFQHSVPDHSGSIAAGRRTVEVALEKLKDLAERYSSIALRGVHLLNNLLAEEARRHSGPKKRRADEAELPAYGNIHKRLTTSVPANSIVSLQGFSTSLASSPTLTESPTQGIDTGYDTVRLFDSDEAHRPENHDVLDWYLSNPVPAVSAQWFGEQSDLDLQVDFWRLLQDPGGSL